MKNFCCYPQYNYSRNNQRFGSFLVPFVGGLLIGGIAAPYFINNKNNYPMSNNPYNNYPSYPVYNYPTYQYGNFTYPYSNGFYHY